MALPALRARLGMGLGRSYTTGIARGGVRYGKTMTTAARPIDGTRALVAYCAGLLNIVGVICGATYLTELRRKVDEIQSNVDRLVKDQSKVDKIQSDVDLLVKDQRRRNSIGL